ncbi:MULTISPECIES: DUF4298 domain-containing protein [unclassified Moraxella]|uniref:DUF4298 domain-containing protein n=1 Tax=unclassified Moraxella TaxID=2685852 RepID=UPI003AF75B3B
MTKSTKIPKPFTPRQIEQLVNAQRLNDRIHQHNDKLIEMYEELNNVLPMIEELEKFYFKDWGKYYDKEISEADLAEINRQAEPKGHSVLGEDTIWNTLSTTRQLRIDLLKVLANHL